MKLGTGQKLYKTAKLFIPGGTQLLSKRPELHLPELWPAYYSKAKGCEIWDLDGNKFIDMSYMGIGANIIGYSDDKINEAVKKAIDDGSMTTLNCPEEVELAKLMCKIHPWAKMVRYSKTGGEAVAIAIRIARASTGKDLILICGYHGWHDWYLSTNLADDTALDGHLLPGLEPKGVPRTLKGSSLTFNYNNINEFLELIKNHKEKVAAVVMEPIRNKKPEKGFLEKIREVTKENNIILIFDEVSSGWRLTAGGAHLKFGVNPDIAVFAKALSNGYPMSAIIGSEKAMQSAQTSFISSTYWTERIGLVAALKTINTIKEENVPAYLEKVGKKVQEGWKSLGKKHNLNIHVGGIYPLSHFSFEYGEPLVLKTLFTQIMLEKGFLGTTVYYASYAHKSEHIDKYLEAVDYAFGVISQAINNGNAREKLKGPVCHSGFKRLN